MTQAGEISQGACQALRADPGSVLVDVRNPPEWESVGVPDVAGMVFAQWTLADRTPNPGLLGELARAGVAQGHTVYFLCRSGQGFRAAAGAAASAGYRSSYNVSDGFEGPPGPRGRRTVSGWKNQGLAGRYPP